MPAAVPFIPAAIGAGSSLIGGISGKGAAKRQEKLAREQFALLKPLLEAQGQAAQFSLQQSKPFIRGAGQAMMDLQERFYKPLALGNTSSINAFLSKDIGAINRGYRSGVKNTAQFAPRGGGRVSALVQGDMDRQSQISDLIFGARRQGAEGLQNSSQQLGALGTGLLGAGLSGGNQATALLQNQQGLAQRASERSDDQLGALGESLGGFLGSIFEKDGRAKQAPAGVGGSGVKGAGG
jgi:hypothetical protein